MNSSSHRHDVDTVTRHDHILEDDFYKEVGEVVANVVIMLVVTSVAGSISPGAK